MGQPRHDQVRQCVHRRAAANADVVTDSDGDSHQDRDRDKDADVDPDADCDSTANADSDSYEERREADQNAHTDANSDADCGNSNADCGDINADLDAYSDARPQCLANIGQFRQGQERTLERQRNDNSIESGFGLDSDGLVSLADDRHPIFDFVEQLHRGQAAESGKFVHHVGQLQADEHRCKVGHVNLHRHGGKQSADSIAFGFGRLIENLPGH